MSRLHRCRRRAGSLSALLALILPGLLLAAMIVLSIGRGTRDAAELRNAANAAALAAVSELAVDDLLTTDPATLDALMAKGRDTARGWLTYPTGKIAIADTDIAFGSLVYGYGNTFAPFDPVTDPNYKTLNAVKVTAKLTANASKTYTALALFDTNVVGFRPVFDRAIPMAPFAIYDGTGGWTDTVSAARTGDQYALASLNIVFGVPPTTSPGDIPTVALTLGTTTRPNQVLNGITATDLAGAPFNGSFSLDTTQDPMTATVSGFDSATLDFKELGALASAFNQKRTWVWPVYQTLTPADPMTGTPDTVTITGFVAGRIIQVDSDATPVDPITGESEATFVRLTVTEAVYATPTAITFSQAPATGNPLPPAQRYVGKVRLGG